MSRRGGWGDDGGDEASLGEEEAELLKEAATEDHTVLLIDARPPMLQPDPNEGGRCPLASSLEAATAVLRRIIMQSGSGARNKVGVMLFGAEQAEAEDEDEDEEEGKAEGAAASSAYAAVGAKHFFLQPLAPPNATRIGELSKLCKEGVDLAAELRLRWPEQQQQQQGAGGGGGALHKALRTCLRTLESGARKVDRDAKRIWLFTNEDDPAAASAGGGDAAEPTRQGIKDALDSRAEVRLYYFPVPEDGGFFRDFDVDRFYGPLLAKQALGQAEWEGEAGGGEWDDEDEDADDAKLVDATAGGVARLKEEAGKRAFRKRRYARMGLHLAPAEAEEEEEYGEGKGGLTLAVALYKTVQPAKKPTAVQLAAETNRRLDSSTRFLSDALVKYVDVELEARRTLEFAGTALDWDKAQYDAVKRAVRGEAGIHLLGFVPAADLAWELSVAGPTLLYPEESVLKGCTRAFIALREAMLRRGVMALVRFHATTRSEPRMAVLLAHPDSPGLELVKLPFLDDVRPVVATADGAAPVPRPSAETVAAAARVVQAVLPKEGFNPEALPNPALRKFFTVLEALALEAEAREWDEEAEDATFVQWEVDDKAREKLEQATPALSAWTAACFEDSGGYEVGPAAKANGGKGKGKAAAGGGGGGGGKKPAASKKRKAAKDEDEDEGGEGEEGSVASAGSGNKKGKKPAPGLAKKPRAVAASASASASAVDNGEEDEWGEKVGRGHGSGEDEDVTAIVQSLLSTGEIHKKTVAQLKEYCKQLGVGVSGKKGDLVDRLKQALEEF